MAWCWIARGAGLTGFNDVVVVGVTVAFVSSMGNGVGLAVGWGFFCLNERRQLLRVLFELFMVTLTAVMGAGIGAAWSELLHLMHPQVKVTASTSVAPMIMAHI